MALILWNQKGELLSFSFSFFSVFTWTLFTTDEKEIPIDLPEQVTCKMILSDSTRGQLEMKVFDKISFPIHR
jgi:hypothetical protein